MNKITVFNNDEFGSVRTVQDGDKTLFCATDVAKALGYSRPADAITAHCRGSVKHRVLTNGGEQEVKFIPEGDVYRLIIRSKLPGAEKFERWVFDEVLPSIRKTGLYVPDFSNPALAARAWADEYEKRMLAENTVAIQSQQIAELQPKANYCDVILSCKNAMPITKIAKDYGLSAQALNKILHNGGIQYKMSGTWLLYTKYAEQGYTKTTTFSTKGGSAVVHTNWTQKGRLFLYDFLKSKGYLPLIEQEGIA